MLRVIDHVNNSHLRTSPALDALYRDAYRHANCEVCLSCLMANYPSSLLSIILDAGAGAAIPAAANAATKMASAGMSQTERAATTNLMQGIKEATPDFNHTNTFQNSANAAGNAVGVSDGLTPLLEKKEKL